MDTSAPAARKRRSFSSQPAAGMHPDEASRQSSLSLPRSQSMVRRNESVGVPPGFGDDKLQAGQSAAGGWHEPQHHLQDRLEPKPGPGWHSVSPSAAEQGPMAAQSAANGWKVSQPSFPCSSYLFSSFPSFCNPSEIAWCFLHVHGFP